MPITDKIKLRKWQGLEWWDPKPVLQVLRRKELEPDWQLQPKDVRNLRTRDLAEVRAMREAALFAYGMTQRNGKLYEFSPVEDQDFDFLVRHTEPGKEEYTPVQLKELIDEERNPKATIQEAFDKFKKYSAKDDLVGAVLVNREVTLKADELDVDGIDLQQLFIYGSGKPDQSSWWIWGDFLDSPILSRFPYPEELGDSINKVGVRKSSD